jgi:3-phenylpropionate/trans-cinnamate dioxygenase ferredoxin reductase subunit
LYFEELNNFKGVETKNMTNYSYKYLIIGGGMTADAAARSIRGIDSEGTIGLISNESDPPYARPPLSKSLWKGEETIEDIDLYTSEIDLTINQDRLVTKIDRSSKKVLDAKENQYSYEKLLIATGGTPKKLPNIDVPGLIYYRTLADYKKLLKVVDKNKKFAILGGGFIGSEIAAAIKMYKPKADITMIFLENGIGGLIFPEKLSNFINDYYEKKGIKIISNDLVTQITKDDKGYLVETKGGKKVKVDTVIAGLGIKPNIELAKAADLKIDDGIVVNEYLQTNDPNIYAAGDVAFYYNSALDKNIRVEHEDNALSMGDIAGQNMTGKKIVYDHISYFYSDLFDLGYEAVGILDPKLETVEDWKEPFEEGVVYYLRDGRVKGVLLWNVWEKTEEARGLIAETGPISATNLKGRI